jgi:hypothetical protein
VVASLGLSMYVVGCKSNAHPNSLPCTVWTGGADPSLRPPSQTPSDRCSCRPSAKSRASAGIRPTCTDLRHSSSSRPPSPL